MSPWLDLARVHAPLLILMTPLIGAALVFALPSRRASWVVACVAALLTAVIAFDIGALAAMTGVMPLFAQETIALRYGGFAAFAAPLPSASPFAWMRYQSRLAMPNPGFTVVCGVVIATPAAPAVTR